MGMESILFSVVALLVGGGVGFAIRHAKATAERKDLEGKAESILEKAKRDSSDIKYKARKEGKDIVKEERDAWEKEKKAMLYDISEQEKSLAKKEAALDQKKEEYDRQILSFKQKEDEQVQHSLKLVEEQNKYKERQKDIAVKLENVAGMSREDAKRELSQAMQEEARVDAAKYVRKIEEEMEQEAEKKAKRILSIAIARFAGEFVAEQTISAVELPHDDMKGRLIGREGRNIRAFEQICGVDLIIDDTPEVVVVSTFNVVRREIAKLTLQKLIADGRIHPAKIEEFYERSKKEVDERILEQGEKAQMEIGVHGMHPEVLKLIGSLTYRTSYTQNQYQHSLEVGMLCGAMAAELGLNVKQARRAGLLHDVGKCLDASAEGSHAVVGADFIKRYGEAPDIVHAVRAHHYDVQPESVLAHLVIAADALSGARPGIRKAMVDSYVSRLSDIEKIVNSFEGVSKSYAISAGREVRVLVENDRVTDDETVMLSRDIAKKIEEEMSYPGTIKVTVIRETKAIGIAK
jgi:ribonuclease Y